MVLLGQGGAGLGRVGWCEKMEGVLGGGVGAWGWCRQSLSQNALVQGFLFYPDGSVDGETPPVLTTQHVLAELGRVHTTSTRCRHAETFLEKTLQNLKTEGRERTRVKRRALITELPCQ